MRHIPALARVAVAATLLGAPADLASQVPGQKPAFPAAPMPAAEFVELARAGTARYRDRSTAIRDGYRAVGPDFPWMGEHWVRARSELLDPAQPQILSYATIAGEVTLVGAAYAIPVADGERPPEWPAGGKGWHYHSEMVQEESYLFPHSELPPEERSGVRVAVLHAWIWLENPAGTFETENWTLPYVRVGLAPPKEEPPYAAAKALSLASGGDQYYHEAIRAASDPSAEDDAAIRAVLERYRLAVERWLTERSGGAGVSPSEMATLKGLWGSMWAELREAVSDRVSGRPPEMVMQ